MTWSFDNLLASFLPFSICHVLITIFICTIQQLKDIVESTLLSEDVRPALGDQLLFLPVHDELVFDHHISQALHIAKLKKAECNHTECVEEFTFHL